jgi:hypothetical protein
MTACARPSFQETSLRIVTSDQRLGLAPHVRACASDGQVILLDLRNSQYVGVGGAQSGALADRVEGWPRSPSPVPECANAAATNQLVASLLARGLLAQTRSKRPPHATVEEATTSLDAEHGAPNAGIGAGRLAQFVRAAAVTSLWMRFRSLQAIATAVQGRRERLQASASASSSLAAVRTGTAAYERLRPFVFTAHENCLHDSLALVGFLASEGVFPRWVIGVKTRPFGAHSWVQMGSIVLNDQHETVRQFRPILVV